MAARPARARCAAPSRAAASSSTTQAPALTGAVSRRPPWRRATRAAIARPWPRRPAWQRVGRERGDRRRQARALVAHLDAHVRACRVRADPHRPGAVLERVEHEVADRLGEPQPVGVHEQPRAGRVEQQLAAERAGQRPPALDRLGEQRAHVERLGELGRAAAARRGVEVREREPRAAQLELDRGDAPRARRVGDDAVQARAAPR